MITDEMWEKFTQALGDTGTMRAALEAVAPMILAPLEAENKALRNFAVVAEERMETFLAERPKLIAQGMREAHQIAAELPDKYNDDGSMEPDWDAAQAAILTRAQELDPK